MNDTIMDKAIAGALVALLHISFWIARFIWRTVTKVVHALPSGLEDAARAAGSATAKAERAARNAAHAFQEGRRSQE